MLTQGGTCQKKKKKTTKKIPTCIGLPPPVIGKYSFHCDGATELDAYKRMKLVTMLGEICDTELKFTSKNSSTYNSPH